MAKHIPLRLDETLRSVVPRLENESDFIPAAYKVINQYTKTHGPVVLRIGVSPSSKGKRPNYRIDHAETGDVVATIDGDTHRSWIGAEASREGKWSTAAMTHAEVGALLGEVRARTRR